VLQLCDQCRQLPDAPAKSSLWRVARRGKRPALQGCHSVALQRTQYWDAKQQTWVIRPITAVLLVRLWPAR